jgi:hypothetical protein
MKERFMNVFVMGATRFFAFGNRHSSDASIRST